MIYQSVKTFETLFISKLESEFRVMIISGVIDGALLLLARCPVFSWY